MSVGLFSVCTISIHAPREGSDKQAINRKAKRGISIHAPREGSDSNAPSKHFWKNYFYPRSPRGERPYRATKPQPSANNFYPRSPRGERPVCPSSRWSAEGDFYPRSPRGERQFRPLQALQVNSFLSTLPARGATHPDGDAPGGIQISIHAPREGSDLVVVVDEVGLFGISIHAPREGSDLEYRIPGPCCKISIHAPREGSDSC